MKPTRCILLLSTFILTSLNVSGNWSGWLSGQQTRQPPIQSEKYHCRKDTVSSSDDEHIVTQNM